MRPPGYWAEARLSPGTHMEWWSDDEKTPAQEFEKQ